MRTIPWVQLILALLLMLNLLATVTSLMLLRSWKPQARVRSLTQETPKDLYKDRMLTEQTLEIRRLTNLLISKDTMDFHAISAVNPEIQGTSQLATHPQAAEMSLNPYVSSDGRDADTSYPDESMVDQGFDGNYDQLPK